MWSNLNVSLDKWQSGYTKQDAFGTDFLCQSKKVSVHCSRMSFNSFLMILVVLVCLRVLWCLLSSLTCFWKGLFSTDDSKVKPGWNHTDWSSNWKIFTVKWNLILTVVVRIWTSLMVCPVTLAVWKMNCTAEKKILLILL